MSSNKLESLLIQNFDLSEKVERQLLSMANFSTFLQLNCSNFRLKLYEGHLSYQNCQRN